MHLVWLSGAGCDGCTMATLGSRAPRLEDVLAGELERFPAGMPAMSLVHPALSLSSGEDYRSQLLDAARGALGPFFLVLEGSVMDESKALAQGGSFSRLGTEDGRPLTAAHWVERLAPKAEAVVAIGSCATWGGIPAADPNPTGARGLEEHLGPDFRSRSDLPVVNVPGCAPSGEAFLETVVYVVLHWKGLVPLDLDEEARPRWLYDSAAHPLPPRADDEPPALTLARRLVADHPDLLAEDGGNRADVVARTLDVTKEHAREALELLGRSSTGCPVPRNGWMRGTGGCSRVGGSCIGCTAPGFADRHLEKARPGAAGAFNPGE